MIDNFKPVASLWRIFLFLMVPSLGQAQLAYITNNGAITITGYYGSGGELTIPDTINDLPVTIIGNNAFYGWTSLTSVTIPSSVTDIENQAFAGCGSLTNITIGTNVTSIGINAFDGCSSMISLIIPNSVISIGDTAFYACRGLTSITIGSNVTSIGTNAFYFCSSLMAINVDVANASYSSVDGILFDTTHTSLLKYPGGKVGNYTIPDSVTSIAIWAFNGCGGLTSITIGSNVSSIEDHAFDSCYSVTNVTIGTNVSSIGNSAFAYCTSLTGIIIPGSVTTLGNAAFGFCTSLTGVYFQGNAPGLAPLSAFATDNNATIYYFPGTSGWSATFALRPTVEMEFAYTINSNTITITDYSCTGGLASIPSSINGLPVTCIGNSAFAYCTTLTSVTIPDSVTNIEDNAFFGCTRLSSITMGTNLITVGGQAFYFCTSLTSITIPASVSNIGGLAFIGCTSLSDVYFTGNAPRIGSYLFTYDNPVVHYLPGTTGWGTTFAGCPTALWNLQVRSSGVSFDGQSNGFGFTITGSSNLVIVVEASTSLANLSWSPISTNTLTDGSIYFSDPQWTNYPTRFYRIRSP